MLYVKLILVLCFWASELRGTNGSQSQNAWLVTTAWHVHGIRQRYWYTGRGHRIWIENFSRWEMLSLGCKKSVSPNLNLDVKIYTLSAKAKRLSEQKSHRGDNAGASLHAKYKIIPQFCITSSIKYTAPLWPKKSFDYRIFISGLYFNAGPSWQWSGGFIKEKPLGRKNILRLESNMILQYSSASNLKLPSRMQSKRLFKQFITMQSALYRRQWKGCHIFTEMIWKWSLRQPELLQGIPKQTGLYVGLGAHLFYQSWIITPMIGYMRTTVPGKGWMSMLAISRKI